MADQEIAKHTRKVVQLLGSREHGFAHKLREMALEIFTIVFAVSLSIWLHGLSQHSHQQQEVRAFLLGLKIDLKQDIEQLAFLNAAYREADANYTYLANLAPDQAPEAKFDEAYRLADLNRFFVPIRSRYEGFKSSGKLTNIESERLLNDILNLYQSVHPAIERSETGWRHQQERLRAYRELELDHGEDTATRYKLTTTPKAKRILKRMLANEQLYERYHNYVELASNIVKEIEHAYPDAAAH